MTLVHVSGTLVYAEPVATLAAVDTFPIKDPACLEAGHSDWAVTNTMSK